MTFTLYATDVLTIVLMLSLRPAWPKWRNPISIKNTKNSWVWWHAPVIPATWVAEAGDSLEPGGWGCSEPRSHHCTPAWITEQDSVSKTNKQASKQTDKQTNTFTVSHHCSPSISSQRAWEVLEWEFAQSFLLDWWISLQNCLALEFSSCIYVFFLMEMKCHFVAQPGMQWSQLTTTYASWAQTILLLQPPE